MRALHRETNDYLLRRPSDAGVETSLRKTGRYMTASFYNLKGAATPKTFIRELTSDEWKMVLHALRAYQHNPGFLQLYEKLVEGFTPPPDLIAQTPHVRKRAGAHKNHQCRDYP